MFDASKNNKKIKKKRKRKRCNFVSKIKCEQKKKKKRILFFTCSFMPHDTSTTTYVRQ